MASVLSIAFDLGWASDTGFALVTGWPIAVVRHGCISPPKRRGKVTDEVRVARGLNLMRGVSKVLALGDAFFLTCEKVIVSYEDPTRWLLAAARGGGKRRRPVTRASLLGAVHPLACFWLAYGLWRERWAQRDIELVALDTRKARRDFDVDTWCCLEPMTQKLLDSKKYDGLVKAEVGAAVYARLKHEGIGLVSPTDHEADALLFALVMLDRAKMEG